MLDAFHVVNLTTGVVDAVRRRVQQDMHGHRGRQGDPLYRIRNILHAGEENVTDRQRARLATALTAREEHLEVEVAWRCAQQVRDAYHQPSHAVGEAIAEKVLASFTSCPIPEVARLRHSLKRWSREFLGYFDTDGASNGGPKPSTASSSCTGASPAASATATTTDSDGSSSAAYSYDPKLSGEELVWERPGSQLPERNDGSTAAGSLAPLTKIDGSSAFARFSIRFIQTLLQSRHTDSPVRHRNRLHHPGFGGPGWQLNEQAIAGSAKILSESHD